MAYQSMHVYTFSRDVYFKYSPQMVSNQEQSGQPLLVRTRLPLGAEAFFVRQAPNHKHLREPAARGAAATTFVMTLPVPHAPAPQVRSRSSASRSCLWKGQPPLQPMGRPHRPAEPGELCLWSRRSAGDTFSRRSSFWRITHLWLRNQMGSYNSWKALTREEMVQINLFTKQK